MPFDIVANLRLQAPTNVTTVANQIKSALQGVAVQVLPVIAASTFSALQKQLQAGLGQLTITPVIAPNFAGPLNSALTQLQASVTAVVSAIQQQTNNLRTIQTQLARPAQAQQSGFGGGGRGLSAIPEINQSLSFARQLSRAESFIGRVDKLLPHFDQADFRAANAVGNGSRLEAVSGAGGAVKGALEGGFVGSIFGPFGLALGVAAGSIHGFATAARQAEIQLVNVRIHNAETAASLRFGRAASSETGHGFDGTDDEPRGVEAFDDARRKRFDQLQLNNRLFGLERAYRPEGAKTDFVKANNEVFDKTRPALTAAALRQVTVAGKNNVDADPLTLLKNLNAQSPTVRRFVDSTGLSEGRKSEDVLKDLVVNIRGAQRTGQAEGASSGENNAATQFAALVQTLGETSSSLKVLKEVSGNLADTFHGQLSANKVSAGVENGIHFGSGTSATQLKTLQAGIGPDAFKSGVALENAASILPGLLSGAAAAKPHDQGEFVGSVQKGLGAHDIDPQVIATVVASLNAKTSGDKLSGTLKKATGDARGLSESVLSPLTGSLEKAGVKAGHSLEEAANALILGLVNARKQLSAIGLEQDKLGELDLRKQRADVNAAKEGRGAGELSLAQLQRPFDARQERLAGPIGLNPDAVAKQLADTQKQIGPATEREQNAFAATGGKGGAFIQASQELVNLKAKAVDLQTALKGLTEASRDAAAHEKLNRAIAERDSGRSFNESFALKDLGEQARVGRGAALANQAAGQGNLTGFSTEDKRLLHDLLQSLGTIKLTGIEGGPQADALKNKLFGDAGPAPVDAAKAQIDQLGEVLKGNANDAVAAQKGLIENQKTLQAEYLAGQTTFQERFFQRLEQALLVKSRAVEPIAPPVGLAKGGSVFTPKGTDTVPAMLTPGEFVVSKSAAQSNRGLLEKLNSGAVHMAAGGIVDDAEALRRRVQGPDPEPVPVKKPGLLDKLAAAGKAIANPELDLPEPEQLPQRENRAKPVGGFAIDPVAIERQNFADARAEALANPAGAAGLAFAKLSGAQNVLAVEQEGKQATLLQQQLLSQTANIRPGQDTQNKFFSKILGSRQASNSRVAKSDSDLQNLKRAILKSQGRSQELTIADKPRPRFQRFAAGGTVLGNGNGDSVPALLTPGERVIPRDQNDRSQSPANASAPPGTAELTQAMALFGTTSSQLVQGIALFNNASSALVSSFAGFGERAGALADALKSIPSSLTVTGQQTVVVNHNGAQVFAELEPAIAKMVKERTQAELQKVFSRQLPDAGVVIESGGD